MKNQHKNCSFNYKHGKLELVTESGDMLFTVSLRDACTDENMTPGKVDESTRYAIQDYIEMCLIDSGASCDQFTLENVVDMIYEDKDICSKMFSYDIGNDNALSEFDHFFGEAVATEPKSAVDKFYARFNRTPSTATAAPANKNNELSNNPKQNNSDTTKQESKHSPLDDFVAQHIIDAFINSYSAKTNTSSNQNTKAAGSSRNSTTMNDLTKLGVSSSKVARLSKNTYECYRHKVDNIRNAVDTIIQNPTRTSWKYYIEIAVDNNGTPCIIVYFAYGDVNDKTYQMSFHLLKHDVNNMGKAKREKIGSKVKTEYNSIEYLESLAGSTEKIKYSYVGARIPATNIKRDFNVTV